MMGLVVPAKVVAALGPKKRPPVVVTIGEHSWRTRIAIMQGRHLIGLSNANRRAAGVETGQVITVIVELDVASRVAKIPVELKKALNSSPKAQRAFESLTESQRSQHTRVVDSAKKPDTRVSRATRIIEELEGR